MSADTPQHGSYNGWCRVAGIPVKAKDCPECQRQDELARKDHPTDIRGAEPLDLAYFPDAEEGWLVPRGVDSVRITRLVREGWRATPNGPDRTAVWR